MCIEIHLCLSSRVLNTANSDSHDQENMRNYNGNLFLIITHNKYQIFHGTLYTGQYELVLSYCDCYCSFPYGL